MRNFDPDMMAEFMKEVVEAFCLLEFQFTDTYRYCDRDVSVFVDGVRFYPIGFSFDKISLSSNMSVDSVNMTIDDVNGTFKGIILNEDVRNKTAIIKIGVRLTDGSEIVEDLFTGIVASWDIEGESSVKVEIANEFILWSKKSIRKHPASCPWVFKGTECNYGGTAITLCDKSYDTCLSIGNEDNFGGFRFLPVIAEQELYWGRTT